MNKKRNKINNILILNELCTAIRNICPSEIEIIALILDLRRYRRADIFKLLE